jgi:predicted ArsR family transcriptional regulator
VAPDERGRGARPRRVPAARDDAHRRRRGRPDGEARAYDAGVRWGRALQAAEPEATVVELLDRQGFGATACGGCIEMRRCPFAALAEEAPQVICTLHRGIVDGALAAAGAGTQVEQLDPFVEPGLCVARLG